MEEPSKEFAALLSHAVQERLKTIVEKLSVIAEHRLDIVKVSCGCLNGISYYKKGLFKLDFIIGIPMSYLKYLLLVDAFILDLSDLQK